MVGTRFLIPMLLLSGSVSRAQVHDPIHEPYRLDARLQTRSISFENLFGEPRAGSKAESRLGVGRKGTLSRDIKPGETVTLCGIKGPATIRHIWLTTVQKPGVQRAAVLRAWWEEQDHPSIECPIGDFITVPDWSARSSIPCTDGISPI